MVIFAYFTNLRAVRMVFEGFVHNMPESTNQNETFEKTAFENIATGSHSRVSKMKIYPGRGLISAIL